jgi:hypothetical protein
MSTKVEALVSGIASDPWDSKTYPELLGLLNKDSGRTGEMHFAMRPGRSVVDMQSCCRPTAVLQETVRSTLQSRPGVLAWVDSERKFH